MLFHFFIGIAGNPPRADNAVSKNKTDGEIGPSTVTLSEAKGLSRWAARCFAEFTLSVANVLSMTVLFISRAIAM
jgi:3-methyladenine DNA glycosylase/8-oxoguanine DNA glycosylase